MDGLRSSKRVGAERHSFSPLTDSPSVNNVEVLLKESIKKLSPYHTETNSIEFACRKASVYQLNSHIKKGESRPTHPPFQAALSFCHLLHGTLGQLTLLFFRKGSSVQFVKGMMQLFQWCPLVLHTRNTCSPHSTAHYFPKTYTLSVRILDIFDNLSLLCKVC